MMSIYQVGLSHDTMGMLDIFKGEMSTKQMGIVVAVYMVALVVFGALAVLVIHGLGWQWL